MPEVCNIEEMEATRNSGQICRQLSTENLSARLANTNCWWWGPREKHWFLPHQLLMNWKRGGRNVTLNILLNPFIINWSQKSWIGGGEEENAKLRPNLSSHSVAVVEERLFGQKQNQLWDQQLVVATVSVSNSSRSNISPTVCERIKKQIQ